jgi:hypothetical protein
VLENPNAGLSVRSHAGNDEHSEQTCQGPLGRPTAGGRVAHDVPLLCAHRVNMAQWSLTARMVLFPRRR